MSKTPLNDVLRDVVQPVGADNGMEHRGVKGQPPRHEGVPLAKGGQAVIPGAKLGRICARAGRLLVQGKANDAARLFDKIITQSVDCNGALSKDVQSDLYVYRGISRINLPANNTAPLEDFSHALKLSPSSCEAWNGRAMYHLEHGDTENALSDINSAIHLHPDRPALYSNRSAIHITDNDFTKAHLDCDMAIKLDPDFSQAYVNRAVCFSSTEPPSLSLALQDITRAIDLDPCNSSFYCVRAGILARHDRLDNGLADLDQAITLQPGNSALFRLRAQLHAKNADWFSATSDFSIAIDLDPIDLESFIGRGEALQELFRWKDSVVDFQKAIELGSAQCSVYPSLAQAFVHLNQFDEANEFARKCLAIADADSDSKFVAHCSLGMVSMLSSEYSEGVSHFSNALELSPLDSTALFNRAICRFECGEYQLSIRDINDSLKANDKSSQGACLRCRGRAFLALDQIDKAMLDFQLAISLDKGNSQNYHCRAQAYLKMMDYDNALGDFAIAVDLDPENGMLKRLYQKALDLVTKERYPNGTPKKRRVGNRSPCPSVPYTAHS